MVMSVATRPNSYIKAKNYSCVTICQYRSGSNHLKRINKSETTYPDQIHHQHQSSNKIRTRFYLSSPLSQRTLRSHLCYRAGNRGTDPAANSGFPSDNHWFRNKSIPNPIKAISKKTVPSKQLNSFSIECVQVAHWDDDLFGIRH